MKQIDNICLEALGLKDTQEINVNVNGELMKNMQKASSITPSQDIDIVQDSQGNALIFSIGEDKHLNLALPTNGSATGYKTLNLTQSIADIESVQHFDIIQNQKGQISLVFAYQEKEKHNTLIKAAYAISNDLSKVNWETLKSFASTIEGIDEHFISEKIILGASDTGRPLTIIAGSIQEQESYYLINNHKVTQLELPENVHKDNLIDLKIGYAFGQKAFYFLYNIGESQTLEATTLPDAFQGSETYNYSPHYKNVPADLKFNCVAPVVTSNHPNPFNMSSDIFVGTDQGIQVFPGGYVNQLETITDQVKDVHQLVVKQDEDSVVIWAVASPNQLYYIYGQKAPDHKGGNQSQAITWNDPILFASDVLHIAPIRSFTKKTNDLYVVSQAKEIVHHWQDPDTTVWSKRTIKIKDEEYLLNQNTYTTHINFGDDQGTILRNQTIRLTSSIWVYAQVNGKTYSLDKDNPAMIPIDAMGNVTIVNMASDISSPVYHVESGFFSETINIYPNGHILKGLQDIKSGDDLRNAQTQDGKPVLTQQLNDNTANGIAQNMGHISNTAAKLTEGSFDNGNVFVSISHNSKKHTGKLDASHLPNGFVGGMALKSGQWHPIQHTAGTMLAGGSFLHHVKTFAGDALHWVGHEFESGIEDATKGIIKLQDGVSWALHKVGDVLHLVLTLQDKILSIALNTFLVAFKALNWVLKLVGIDLTVILKWLGHLFGWDAIWKTHKVIARVTTNAADTVVKHAEKYTDNITSFLETQLDHILPHFMAIDAGEHGKTPVKHHHSPSFLHSSAGNWIFHHILHTGFLSGGHSSSTEGGDFFSLFAKEIIEPALLSIIHDVEQDIKDVARLLDGNIESVIDLLKTLLDPVKKIALGAVKFIGKFVEAIQPLFHQEIKIPFLSTFYKFVTTLLGDEEDLNFINGLALIIAIPANIVSRASGTGKLFDHSTYGLDAPDFFEGLLTQAPTGTFLSAGSDSNSFLYTKYCGGIAGIVGAIDSVIDLMWVLSEGEEDDGSSEGLIGGAVAAPIHPLDILQAVLKVFKYGLSVPLKLDNMRTATHNLKITAYILALVKDLVVTVSVLLRKRYPDKVLSEKGQQWTSGIINTLALILLVAGDVIRNQDTGEIAESLSADLLSTGGGLVSNFSAVGDAEEGEIIGTGFSILGAGLGSLWAFLSHDKKPHYTINPGG